MAKRITIALVVIAVCAMVAGAGCSGGKGSDPGKVAEKYWKVTKEGSVEDVKPYVTKESFEALKEEKKGPAAKKEGDYTLGEAEIEGDKATIPTTITDQGFSFELQTVLVKEDGKWKVDVAQTMMSMFGGAMGEMMKGLGQAMGEGVKGMGEAVKGIDEATEGVEKAAQGVEKAFEKEAEPKETAAADPVPTGGKTFDNGDPVLVEWHGRWWPAKVIEVGSGKWKIHYDGYSNSWDEWVGTDRIRTK